MIRTHVVSPSASGTYTQERFLKIIEQEHVAIIGYSPEDEGAGTFFTIKDGDLVIIARGANWQKETFFAGIADGDDWFVRKVDGEDKYAHKLREFVDLRGQAIPFNIDCTGGNSKNPHRISSEIGSKAADKPVIEKVLSIIRKSQGVRMIENMINLLNSAKQIVLTGAPGTGKTYLARQIAMQMILGKPVVDEGKLSDNEKKQIAEQMGFVQFHPSFDYTDFVEGLRPVKSEDGNALGFERRDGVFKEFCKRAVESAEVGRVDNFNGSWQILLAKLENDERLLIPLISGNGNFPLSLNEYGTGLASRTYDESGKEWIRGQSKFFTKEQVYNVYQGKPGVPSGGHDNYRKAIVAFMYKQCSLMPYKEGESATDENRKPYVMIIDEINRGDISKIFGELFFAIDKGYRGKANGRVKTQYDNLIDSSDTFFGGFYVPENVYIIGTMNDIDRNVESMDFAIRRRFTWKEILPSDRFEAMWSDIAGAPSETREKARRCMERINKVISETNGLGRAFQIGPSYFRELVNYGEADGDTFKCLWDNHIATLVSEYLRGFPDADGIIRKLSEAYFKNDEVAQESEASE